MDAFVCILNRGIRDNDSGDGLAIALGLDTGIGHGQVDISRRVTSSECTRTLEKELKTLDLERPRVKKAPVGLGWFLSPAKAYE